MIKTVNYSCFFFPWWGTHWLLNVPENNTLLVKSPAVIWSIFEGQPRDWDVLTPAAAMCPCFTFPHPENLRFQQWDIQNNHLRGECLVQQWGLLGGTIAHVFTAFELKLLYFWPNFLLILNTGENRWWLKCLRLFHLHRSSALKIIQINIMMV